MRRYNENRYGASDVARRLSLENCRDRLAAVLRPLEVDIGGIVSRDLYFDVAPRSLDLCEPASPRG